MPTEEQLSQLRESQFEYFGSSEISMQPAQEYKQRDPDNQPSYVAWGHQIEKIAENIAFDVTEKMKLLANASQEDKNKIMWDVLKEEWEQGIVEYIKKGLK